MQEFEWFVCVSEQARERKRVCQYLQNCQPVADRVGNVQHFDTITCDKQSQNIVWRNVEDKDVDK